MYVWIWRKLPYGLTGKIVGSLALTGVGVTLLWYFVFPWAEPLLPFDDVQVGDPNSGYSAPLDPTGSPTVGESSAATLGGE